MISLLLFLFSLPIAETSYSCSPIINNSTSSSSNNSSSTNSSDNSSKQVATVAPALALTTPATPAIAAAKYNRPTAAAAATPTSTVATASVKSSSSAVATATTPMQISPTFIEHKYSALAIKEKFFSNLRASRTASATANGSGGSGGGGGNNLTAVASASNGVESTHSGNAAPNAACNMLRAVAVGQMCAMQNEHIHQNLYKKTIN